MDMKKIFPTPIDVKEIPSFLLRSPEYCPFRKNNVCKPIGFECLDSFPEKCPLEDAE